jgi:hypothetical protein
MVLLPSVILRRTSRAGLHRTWLMLGALEILMGVAAIRAHVAPTWALALDWVACVASLVYVIADWSDPRD